MFHSILQGLRGSTRFCKGGVVRGGLKLGWFMRVDQGKVLARLRGFHDSSGFHGLWLR